MSSKLVPGAVSSFFTSLHPSKPLTRLKIHCDQNPTFIITRNRGNLFTLLFKFLKMLKYKNFNVKSTRRNYILKKKITPETMRFLIVFTNR